MHRPRGRTARRTPACGPGCGERRNNVHTGSAMARGHRSHRTSGSQACGRWAGSHRRPSPPPQHSISGVVVVAHRNWQRWARGRLSRHKQ
jgi:hypothetical protein